MGSTRAEVELCPKLYLETSSCFTLSRIRVRTQAVTRGQQIIDMTNCSANTTGSSLLGLNLTTLPAKSPIEFIIELMALREFLVITSSENGTIVEAD